MQDLVVLVADKNIQFALRGALGRPQALGIRAMTHEFRTHMGRDGGVRATGVEVLAPEASRFRHALMVFDFEGCGQEHKDLLALEAELDSQLRLVWGARAKAIIISPEVDIWLWGADVVLREALFWPQHGSIREWLLAKGFDSMPTTSLCDPRRHWMRCVWYINDRGPQRCTKKSPAASAFKIALTLRSGA